MGSEKGPGCSPGAGSLLETDTERWKSWVWDLRPAVRARTAAGRCPRGFLERLLSALEPL